MERIKLTILLLILFLFCVSITFAQNTLAEKNISFTANGVTFEMIFVEGGTFTMGCNAEQTKCNLAEVPTHDVTLSNFYIGKFQITQQLWFAVMETTLERQLQLAKWKNPTYASKMFIYGEGDDYPMYYISYNDCEKFCKLLNQLLADQLPESAKFCFPTEAQWEFAARGGNKSNGYKYSGSNNIDEVAWYKDNSYDLEPDHPNYGVNPVGKKKANELGIYDMSGNIWERCYDVYDMSYYKTCPKKTPIRNPIGPKLDDNLKGTRDEIHRVIRGGCWKCGYIDNRVTWRNLDTMYYRWGNTGFRLALMP
jgi:formylglycine-generating enzyme required for sulfatase activity